MTEALRLELEYMSGSQRAAVLMLLLGDPWLLQGDAQAHSPATVAGWPWYGLVFGQPHIVGSGLIFLDGPLRRSCWPQLRRAGLLAAVTCALALADWCGVDAATAAERVSISRRLIMCTPLRKRN